MVIAEAVGVVYGRVARLSPVGSVVAFETIGAGAIDNRAFGVTELEGGALGGGEAASEMGDGVDVDTFGDDGGQKRALVQESVDGGHGDGPDPRDFAELIGVRVAAEIGGVVDPHDDLGIGATARDLPLTPPDMDARAMATNASAA